VRSSEQTTVLITGVTQGGLGAEVALAISRSLPKLLILAGRDLAKAQATETAIKLVTPGAAIRLLKLDLSSQKQIRQAANEVNGYQESIDRLINNAAIMATSYATTEDGTESQFGTNHIGHFLFTNLIMLKIFAAGQGARIVNVSSAGHRRSPVRFDDYNFGVCRFLLKLILNLCVCDMNTEMGRTAQLTINGRPMAKQRLRIFFSRWH